MNKTDGYCMVRVDPDTHARLLAFLGRLEANRRPGQGVEHPWLDGRYVRLTDAIRELLFRVDEANARSATARLVSRERRR